MLFRILKLLITIFFPSGQVEKINLDGSKEITSSNGLKRRIKNDKTEEIILEDGSICQIYPDGSETIYFSNGDIQHKTEKFVVLY